MSKYIKLEDAIEQVRTVFYKDEYQEWLAIAVDNLINRTADLPTIDIVHCGKCKYNGRGNCPMVWWDDSLQKFLNPCAADDFCSEGKRKDND